jgi:hypothetical protein
MSGTDVLIRPHLDANGKDLAIEHVQDCEDIIERNKRLRNEPQRSDWGRHIGTIPNVILVRWMTEDNVNVMGMPAEEFGKYIKRKLSDPDWAHLRTDR